MQRGYTEGICRGDMQRGYSEGYMEGVHGGGAQRDPWRGA